MVSGDNSLLGKWSGWNSLLSPRAGGGKPETQASFRKIRPVPPPVASGYLLTICTVPWPVGASP